MDIERPDPSVLKQVSKALAEAPLLHHRNWPKAMRGDGAALIAVAMDCLLAPDAPGLATDVAMSRILVHAARGDPAAAVVLAHARRRIARPMPDPSIQS